MSELWAVALVVMLINLPFGWWRAGVRKFSRSWVLAVHVPVPMVVALRLASGLGFRLATFPVMIGAYFTGQFLGGALRRRLGRIAPPAPGTAGPPERTRTEPDPSSRREPAPEP